MFLVCAGSECRTSGGNTELQIYTLSGDCLQRGVIFVCAHLQVQIGETRSKFAHQEKLHY